jgi:hypothetical protein
MSYLRVKVDKKIHVRTVQKHTIDCFDDTNIKLQSLEEFHFKTISSNRQALLINKLMFQIH